MADLIADLAGRRVLVVEDESAVRMYVEDTLEDIGCEVAGSAARLPDAIEKAATLTFDIAILDVNLAGEKTFGLAQWFKDRRTPFIFATGYGAMIIPEYLRATPTLQKPFSQSEMESALREALSAQS